jgi:hypothetical protein
MRVAMARPPTVIDEALAARVESEIDARFDAVFTMPESTAPIAARPDPTGEIEPETAPERMPLFLNPRPATDPGSVRIPTPPPIARPDSAPGLARLPPLRPPSEPEIETEIEMEAEEPPEDARLDDDEPELTVIDSEPEPPEPETPEPDYPEPEIITLPPPPPLQEESAPHLIVDRPPPGTTPMILGGLGDDEPTDIRAAIATPPPTPTPPVKEKPITTISIKQGRTKRLSDGWDD